MKMKKFISSMIMALIVLLVLLPINVKANSYVNSDSLKITDVVTYKTGDSNISSGTITIGNNNGAVTRASAPVGTIGWRISNQYLDGKSQFTFHIDSLTGVRPTSISVVLNISLRHGVMDAPKLYGGRTFTFNAAEIKPGASKSATVDATTGYLAAFGSCTAFSPDGHPNTWALATSTILTNKKNEYFPNYIDPVSKKQAIDGIRTDWLKTGSRPWNGRNTYIKNFESQYGKQSENYWKSVQIHHIRPRNFGGSDEFDNLMPVETNAHRLITKWFVSY